MALLMLAAINLGLIIYGIRRILEERRGSGLPAFFILLAEEDDYLEGMLRFLVGQMKQEEIANPLIVTYELSGYQSKAIADRCARDLSFIAWEIQKGENAEPSGPNLLDLRERGTRQEKLCLIKLFLRRQKYLTAT
ncbi:MAG: hypothetical protein RBT41_00420 [Clostridia bacterium]|nr:hypothetical protein [Clostridia bacterium]